MTQKAPETAAASICEPMNTLTSYPSDHHLTMRAELSQREDLLLASLEITRVHTESEYNCDNKYEHIRGRSLTNFLEGTRVLECVRTTS